MVLQGSLASLVSILGAVLFFWYFVGLNPIFGAVGDCPLAPGRRLCEDYSFPVDIWSAAATIFELATDRVLFKDSWQLVISEFLSAGGCRSKTVGYLPKKVY